MAHGTSGLKGLPNMPPASPAFQLRRWKDKIETPPKPEAKLCLRFLLCFIGNLAKPESWDQTRYWFANFFALHWLYDDLYEQFCGDFRFPLCKLWVVVERTTCSTVPFTCFYSQLSMFRLDPGLIQFRHALGAIWPAAAAQLTVCLPFLFAKLEATEIPQPTSAVTNRNNWDADRALWCDKDAGGFEILKRQPTNWQIPAIRGQIRALRSIQKSEVFTKVTTVLIGLKL